MNSKFYVSYEAARLLKEKGYNETTDYIIDEDNCMMDSRFLLNSELPEYICSCLTKAEAIDWLESKGMCIIVFRRTVDNKVEWRYVIHGHTEIISGFQTRLEAKDAAIINACKLLENGN